MAEEEISINPLASLPLKHSEITQCTVIHDGPLSLLYTTDKAVQEQAEGCFSSLILGKHN